MGSASKDEAILRAIRENRCLMLNYRDYSRVVEPYLLGHDAGGVEVLCAYQLSGGDEAQAPTGWKQFVLADVRGALPVDVHFTGERALPPDARLERVIARVTPAPALAASHAGPERRGVPRHTG